MKETLLPTTESEQRQPVEAVVREFLPLSKSNKDARIYLIGYTSTTERLEYVKQDSDGGVMMRDLLTTRQCFLKYGAPSDRVIIVAVLVGDNVKANQIGAVTTPVKLPIEVWNGDGFETGKGQSAPRVNGSASIDNDYNKKTGAFDKKIQLQIDIKLKHRLSPLDTLTLTAKHDGSAFEEVDAELTFKTKLLKAVKFHDIKDLSLAIKASGKIYADDESADKKLQKLKGKLKAVLSMEIKSISGTLSGHFFVDSAGGVGGGADLTIPWD